MLKRIVPNLLLILVGILFAYGIGELAARWYVKAPPFELPAAQLDYLTAKDVNLRWRFTAENGRNRLGLRNREIVAKAAATTRILFLGDSLIWTGKTSSDQLYTEVIEERLNAARGADAHHIEVINAGIPGYTTYQELEFLKQYGLDMEPDVLVLGFVFNDVYYKYLHKPTSDNLLATDPEVTLQYLDKHSFPDSLLAWSYLANLIQPRVAYQLQKRSGQPTFPFEQRADFFLAWKPYGWNETKPLLSEMKTLAHNNSINFMVIIFPVSDQVNDTYRSKNLEYVLYPQARLKGILEELEIPYLDLTDTLYQNGGIALYEDYLHLNAQGNDVIANTLTDYLQGQPFLKGK